MNGNLSKEIKLNSNNKKIEKIEYTYSLQSIIPNYSQAYPLYKTSEAVGDCYIDPMQTSNYLRSYYEVKNFWCVKKEETHTHYFNSEMDSIKKIIQFEYDQTNLLVCKTMQYSSNQKKIEEITTYPTTCTDGFAVKMKQYNLLNNPIEKLYYVNDVLKLKNKTFYSDKFYNNLMLPEYITFKQETNEEKVDIEYIEYDEKGNLRCFKGKDNINYCYIWSYNRQLPIAEIKNATYSQINAIVGESNLRSLASSNNPDMTKLNVLKDISNILFTTYTYKPLVGMTSMTDPRGVTTYYDYDNFNRLKETYIIENGTKKILQKYDYHYKNQ
jgi:YD repeat-containing protein